MEPFHFLLLTSVTTVIEGVRFVEVGKMSNGYALGTLTTSIKYSTLMETHDHLKMILQEKFVGNDTVDDKKDEYVQMAEQDIMLLYNKSSSTLEKIQVLFGNSTDTRSDHLSRKKRQLAIIGAVAALGVGVYDIVELENMKNRVDADEHFFGKRIQEEAAYINRNSNRIKALEKALLTVADEMDRVEKVDTMVNILTNALQEYDSDLNRFYDGLAEMVSSNICPTLLNVQEVLKSFHALKEKGQQNGYQPAFSVRDSIFRSEMSWYFASGVLHLFLHIPFIHGKPLPMFKLIDMPIILGHEGTNQTAVIVENKNNVLAVNEALTLGVELDATEPFLKCMKRKNLFICPSQVLTKNIDDLCLGRMMRKGTSLTEVCKITVEQPAVEYVARMDERTLLHWSSDQVTITETCSGGPTNVTTTKGETTLVLRDGCELSTPNYVFTHDKDFVEENINLIELPHVDLQLIEEYTTKGTTIRKKVEEILKQVSASADTPDDNGWNYEAVPGELKLFLLPLIVANSVAIMIISICLVTRCKACRTCTCPRPGAQNAY